MRSFLASVTSLAGAVAAIREVLEAGSLLVSIIGGLLALGAGYYAFRIQRRKWQLMNKG